MYVHSIKIKSKMATFPFVAICVALAAIFIAIFYSFVADEFGEYQSKYHICEIICFVYIVIPLIYRSVVNKKEYLSELIVSDSDISFVYKIANKQSRTILINKNNIKKFAVDSYIKFIRTGRSATIIVSYSFLVNLFDGNDISISEVIEDQTLDCNYKFLYALIDDLDLIPNFELNIDSNSEYLKAELDYYKKFGKKIPFLTALKTQLSGIPKSSKVIIMMTFVMFLFFIFYLIYLSLPPFLSETEQNYIDKVHYSKSIEDLDKAKEIISTDPYLYKSYAEIYAYQQDYENAIKYAKIGLEYADNPSVYYKKYKYLTYNPREDLNRLLAKYYDKLKEWDNSILSYSEAIKYSDYHNHSYNFYRGIAYYELQEYSKAKQDFLIHREKIVNCMQSEHCVSFGQKHLQNVDLWINACGR